MPMPRITAVAVLFTLGLLVHNNIRRLVVVEAFAIIDSSSSWRPVAASSSAAAYPFPTIPRTSSSFTSTCRFMATGASSSSLSSSSSADEEGEGGSDTTTNPTSTSTTASSNEPYRDTTTNKEPSTSSTSAPTTDILNSPAFLKRKWQVLQSDYAQVEADLVAAEQRLDAGKMEWETQLDDLQREYSKIQDRMNTQSQQKDSMATVQVARQMLLVLDTMDRAFGQVTPQSESDQAIEAEYKRVYEHILATFHKLGVEEIKSVGAEFDYAVHQAIMQKPSDQYGEGIVSEEFQKGFKVGDQLVRAAVVAVAS